MRKKRTLTRRRNSDQPEGQFAEVLVDTLEQKGMLVSDFADKLHRTYEHIRKLCRGLAFPSQNLLTDICRVLKLDEDEMWQLIVADKIQTKYGGLPMEMAGGRNPRFSRIERNLPKLTKDQFTSLEATIDAWVDSNRQ